MPYSIDSVNFFSIEGIPWILLAWGSLYVFRSLSTLLHETGHAMTALILTHEKVKIRVGAGKSPFVWKSNWLDLSFSIKNSMVGHTEFSTYNLNSKKQVLILVAGPVFSAGAALGGIFLATKVFDSITLKSLTVGWICSNAICFLRNSLPIELKGMDEKLVGIPSDGLQIYRLLRGMK